MTVNLIVESVLNQQKPVLTELQTLPKRSLVCHWLHECNKSVSLHQPQLRPRDFCWQCNQHSNNLINCPVVELSPEQILQNRNFFSIPFKAWGSVAATTTTSSAPGISTVRRDKANTFHSSTRLWYYSTKWRPRYPVAPAINTVFLFIRMYK
jgi:hypothetical protein